MPLTIPPIPNAAPFAAFSDNVGIFSNSKAREIPARLNAIAQALKDHINTLWLAGQYFINGTVISVSTPPFAKIETFSNGIERHQIRWPSSSSIANYLGTNAGYSVTPPTPPCSRAASSRGTLSTTLPEGPHDPPAASDQRHHLQRRRNHGGLCREPTLGGTYTRAWLHLYARRAIAAITEV
jgi:hypothetical protein